MKAKIRFSIILMFLFATFLVNGQEAQKTEPTPSGSGTKAQDHNSTRSNKTASSVAPDNTTEGGSSSSQSKAQDHNSTRSNKTASKAAEDPGSGEGNSKAIDDKTDKSPAARGSKPKPKFP